MRDEDIPEVRESSSHEGTMCRHCAHWIRHPKENLPYGTCAKWPGVVHRITCDSSTCNAHEEKDGAAELIKELEKTLAEMGREIEDGPDEGAVLG